MVEDARAALAHAAALWFGAQPDTVVAVTGSSGKTTTKDMLASVLGRLGPVVAPQGSFNNEIGVPLTLLAATDDAVDELRAMFG